VEKGIEYLSPRPWIAEVLCFLHKIVLKVQVFGNLSWPEDGGAQVLEVERGGGVNLEVKCP
jgi:hypothetical protein